MSLETALETLLTGDQLVLEDVDHLDVLPVLVDSSRSGSELQSKSFLTDAAVISTRNKYHSRPVKHPKDYSMEQRHGQLQNHCCPESMHLRCGFISRVLKI